LENVEQNVIPVGISTPKGGDVTFSATVVPLKGFKFMLEDRELGIFTDLSTDTYTVTIPAGTYGTGRFFITTEKEDDPIEYEELNVRIWSNRHKVFIQGRVSNQAIATVLNLSSQKVLEVNLNNKRLNKFNVPRSLRGIHLVTVIDGNKMKTQKVMF